MWRAEKEACCWGQCGTRCEIMFCIAIGSIVTHGIIGKINNQKEADAKKEQKGNRRMDQGDLIQFKSVKDRLPSSLLQLMGINK